MPNPETPRPTYDPQKVFNSAEWYNSAVHALTPLVEFNHSLAIPRATMAAFSLELYLKCLISLETGQNAPPWHELDKLFKKLSPATRQEIRKLYDNPTEGQEISNRLQLKRGSEKKSAEEKSLVAPSSLNESLKTSARAFDQFRYIFEIGFVTGRRAAWNADYVVLCARKTILKRQPAWAP